jgi:hypothetical protein
MTAVCSVLLRPRINPVNIPVMTLLITGNFCVFLAFVEKSGEVR